MDKYTLNSFISDVSIAQTTLMCANTEDMQLHVLNGNDNLFQITWISPLFNSEYVMMTCKMSTKHGRVAELKLIYFKGIFTFPLKTLWW